MKLGTWATLLVAFSAICLVNCQVCVLKQRPDPSQGGKLTWSLPYYERCFCQAVVRSRQNVKSRGPIDEYSEDTKLLFVYDPRPLTNCVNWNKEALDALLDREYCGRDECASSPCKNRGTCHGKIGKNMCTCWDGYSGDRCETDHEPPVIGNAPGSVTQDTDTGMATAAVIWTPPTASDNSGSHTLTSSHTPGSAFPIGVTMVTLDAVDGAGNAAHIYFNVTIQDHEPPVIVNAPESITQDTDPAKAAAAVIWTPPTASDNSGSQTLTSSHTPGSAFPIGVTMVTYDAVDGSGNAAHAYFNVIILEGKAFGSHYYYFADTAKVDFATAQTACQMMDAKLASIHSQEEADFIGLHTEHDGTSDQWWGYWIGFTDQVTENTFVWTDGTTAGYINWYPGQPSNRGGNEDCATTLPLQNDQWNDASCNKLYAYVCKKQR